MLKAALTAASDDAAPLSESTTRFAAAPRAKRTTMPTRMNEKPTARRVWRRRSPARKIAAA